MSKKLVKAFEDIDNNKEVDYLDEYLASESEDSRSDYEDSDGSTKEGKIEKYKNLLKSIEEEEEKSKQEKKKFDIEIDWTPEIDKKCVDSDEDELDDEEQEAKLKQEKRNKYRKSKKFKNAGKESTSKEANAELELLTMNDKKEKKHFNYENYVENSKKVNKDKKKEKVATDEFKVWILISDNFLNLQIQ